MAGAEWQTSHIVDDIEHVGVDVRPILEVKTERTKLSSFAEWLCDKWPELYESTMIAPASFAIGKNFVFPGKGNLDAPTLMLTGRGPVFSFPRKLVMFGEETNLPDAANVVLKAIDRFREQWPTHNCIRLGVVHEYAFDCQGRDPLDIIAHDFTKLATPEGGELTIRVNRRDDMYNRIIEVQASSEYYRIPSPGKAPEPVEPKLKVRADFNNADMSQRLDEDKMAGILRRGHDFCTTGVLDFLNGKEGRR